jgi:ubiquinone/menaquinone biosynthesis C-methylase UbiE
LPERDDSYSRVHRHFLAPELPPLLERALERIREVGALADVGCGDGAVLWAIAQRVGLPERVWAFDHSPERVGRASELDPRIEGVVADAASLPLEDGVLDAAICSQVIEHVPDDAAVCQELGRVVRPGGWVYVGSVLRSERAFWLYRDQQGRRLLDPTHVREYATVSEFEAIVGRIGEIETLEVSPFRFPVSDLAFRALARLGVLSHDAITSAYVRYGSALRRLRVRPPGYRVIEALVRRM